MSALWAPITGWREDRAAPAEPRSRLQAVAPPATRMARFPFLLVLIGVFGLGMAGLLMLNTTLQNQAFQARALNRQASELTYAQADLENQLDAVAAPQEMARRASAFGMRPNPFPAFLVMPKGKVIGDPRPVTGTEAPTLIVKTAAERAADHAAALERRAARAAAKAAKEKAAAAAAKQKAAEQAAKAKAEAAAKKVAEKKAAAKKAAEKKAAEKKAAEERAARKGNH